MGALKKVLGNAFWSGLCVAGCCGFVLPVSAQIAPAPDGASVVVASAVHASIAQPSDRGATSSELPDSPGTTAVEASSAAPIFQAGQNQTQPPPAQQSPAPTQQAQQKPEGTAAAEAPNATGVAASQPAGVAIAPGKQHRARTIVIRVGAILGAGAAVGTVVALTAATPSKPPGAH
jgi:hypothetical protein